MIYKVLWLFNGLPINRLGYNQRYQQTNFKDTYTFTINNVRYEDIGKYTLQAENNWGKSTCSAEVFIPPTVFVSGKKSLKKIFFNQYT